MLFPLHLIRIPVTSLSFLFPGQNASSFLLFLGDMIFIPLTSSDEVAEVREEGKVIGQDRCDHRAGFCFFAKVT